ncbi:hypothetical protein RDV89_02525 [Nocardioides zeae]|uniref:Uncharacterized protein n=1 Tax=Nocardioides imazamoxiresistens TaxID=3231893 RepID=A0ABU3PRV1_9ACTN|nr:hypothetical protein [Nocardioides zeae]MDT9591926.1 hypothetical protein [Nocardioides zeae]
MDDDLARRFEGHQRGRPVDGPRTQRLRELVATRRGLAPGASVADVTQAEVEEWAGGAGDRIRARPWGWIVSSVSAATQPGPPGRPPLPPPPGSGGGLLVDARRAEVHAFSASPADLFPVRDLDSVEAFERFRALRLGPRGDTLPRPPGPAPEA